MAHPFRVYRMSNTMKDKDGEHVGEVRTGIEQARDLLRQNPSPSTFAGQQTHKLFPKEKTLELDQRIRDP